MLYGIIYYASNYVHKHTKHVHKRKQVEYSYIHINRFDICVLMVSQIIYISLNILSFMHALVFMHIMTSCCL